MIETAMVMAAGHGTRMRPLTDHISKAMVEVGGKPLIDHMLDRLDAVGVKRAVVNVHAHSDHLEAHLKSRKTGPEIIISDERERLLETGGGVVKALPLLGDGPIFICNIDAVWMEFEPVFQGLLDKWRDHMTDLFLLARTDETLGYAGAGDFTLSETGHLTRRSGDSAPYVYAGVQISTLHQFKDLKVEPFSRNKIWNESLKNQSVYGHVLEGFWMHVGDPKSRDISEIILRDYAEPV